MLHEALDVGARGPVDRDAAAARDEAHDVVARDGVATMGQAHEHTAAVRPLDEHTGTAARALGLVGAARARRLMHNVGDRLGLGLDGVLRLGIQDGLDLVAHRARLHLARAHGGEQVLQTLVVEVRSHGVERTRGARRGDAIPALAQVLGQYIAAGSSVVVLGRGGKIAADL